MVGEWLNSEWLDGEWWWDDDGWDDAYAKSTGNTEAHAFSRCLLPPWALRSMRSWSVSQKAALCYMVQGVPTGNLTKPRETTIFGSENRLRYCSQSLVSKVCFTVCSSLGTCGRNWHVLRPHWPTTPGVRPHWIGWGTRNVQRPYVYIYIYTVHTVYSVCLQMFGIFSGVANLL